MPAVLGFGSVSEWEMEYALSMQDPFLSAGLQAEKTRKLNLTMALCGLASQTLKGKGSQEKRVALTENSSWDWGVVSSASTQKHNLQRVFDSFTKEESRPLQ